MKKTYITPNTVVCEMKATAILAGSINSTSNTEAGTGSEDSPVNLGNESGSLWGDED